MRHSSLLCTMIESPIEIRPFNYCDDLVRLTALIHRAYDPHARLGLRYWGTHQSVEDTRSRLESGQGIVALHESCFVGTITVRAPQPNSPVIQYRDSKTWSICQFAVDPRIQGRGVGKLLHDRAQVVARQQGARALALDTADAAVGLIELYRSWGYEVVGTADWRPQTNYQSVVMCKEIS